MMEVRRFLGAPREIADLTRAVWRGDYAGVVPVPLWSASFLDWQVFGDQPGQADYRLAAYDGARLVGTFFARPYNFSLHGRRVAGTMASGLTVHPDYRRKLVGPRLVGAMSRQHEVDGRAFLIGLAHRDPRTMGFQFWEGMRKAAPRRVALLGRVNFWVRVLDARRVANWSPLWHERLATRLIGALQDRPCRLSGADCRPFEEADLAACLALAERSRAEHDLAVVRGPEELRRQLQFQDVARALVREKEGRITALFNYHHLELLGRGELWAGLSDLLNLGEMAGGERLLRAGLAEMAGAGLALALVPGFAAHPRLLFLRAGFLPLPPEYTAVCLKASADFPLGKVRNFALPIM
jgi:hypothetical protein